MAPERPTCPLQKTAPEGFPGSLHEKRNVGGALLAGLPAEEFSHLLLVLVNGGHHHMRGAFVGQLDDPLPQVGFQAAYAVLFQIVVEFDLFGSHCLRLDQKIGLLFPDDGEDGPVGVFRRCAEMDPGSRLFGTEGEAGHQFRQFLQTLLFGFGNTAPQGFEVDSLERLRPCHRVGCRKVFQRPP